MSQREKIETLMAQAQKDYLLGSPQTALRNDLEALRLAKNLGEPHMLARAHIELSRCYRWLHQPNLAMEHIHEALGLFHEFEDETLLNLARFVHGRVLVQLGLSDEAYVEMSKVAKWAKTNRDLEMYVRAQDWMAIVFVLASNFEKAAALFDEIQELQDAHQFKNLKSIIPLHRGFYHTRYADHMAEQGDEQAHRDNFEVAMMWTRHAIDAAFEIGDSWYQFTSLCNAAECAAVLGQFDEAYALLARAEELPQSLMEIGAVNYLYNKS
jgi:tetratricopeptide (TPR) repeat protein